MMSDVATKISYYIGQFVTYDMMSGDSNNFGEHCMHHILLTAETLKSSA